MMRTIFGSAIGGLVAGVLALTASAYVRNPSPGTPAAPFTTLDSNVAAARGMAGDSGLVQCEPHQEAVIRRVSIGGREVAGLSCESRAAMPVQYYGSRVAYDDDMVASPVVRTRVVERLAPVERVVYTQPRVVEQRRKRNWGKTALIIGGGTGAGAGVGALVGGKKGALIGAAIGGGAASIYEVTKR